MRSENDGAEGLRSALELNPALIVLDIMLPKMNGLDLLKQLRLERPTSVLLLSARGDEFDRVLDLNFLERLMRINAPVSKGQWCVWDDAPRFLLGI